MYAGGMEPLTPAEIRTSFVNASQGEAERVPMPGLHDVIWEEREYLGWRHQQSHQRGYLVHWLDDRPVGLGPRRHGARDRPTRGHLRPLDQGMRP